MRRTAAWLVESVLEEQLQGPCTPHGQSRLAPAMASVLLRTCSVQHWFGTGSAEHEQVLLTELRTANPILPVAVRHEYPWTVADIHAAADAKAELAPFLYFMFEAFGDHTAVNWESFQMPTPLGYPIQYRHEYRGLLAVPEPSLQPAPLTVLLRSLFLAAKLISLLPDNCTTPPEVENLACGCLTNIADRLSQLAHNQPSSQASHKSPDEALRQRQICKQLVKLLAPMMSHACIPTSRGCMYCQQRAEAAAKALAAVLKHGGVGVSAAVADAFLAGGRLLTSSCHLFV